MYVHPYVCMCVCIHNSFYIKIRNLIIILFLLLPPPLLLHTFIQYYIHTKKEKLILLIIKIIKEAKTNKKYIHTYIHI